MLEPWNLQEIKSLQGHLAFSQRFISNLARRCQHFNRLMKNDVLLVWDQVCDNVFENIKKYLTTLPILDALMVGKLLILYITT